MIQWNKFPIVRLFLPFAIGIVIAILIDYNFQLSYFLFPGIFLFFTFFVYLYEKFFSDYKLRWIFGACINLCLILYGFHFTQVNTEKFSPQHFSKIANIDSSCFAIANITEPVVEKENSNKVCLEITNIVNGENRIPVMGNVIAYFSKNNNSSLLKYGDQLLIDTKFTEVKKPQNPGEFNYKQYLEFKSVYHQAYVDNQSWLKLDSNKGSFIKTKAIGIRNYFLEVFKKNNLDGKEFAVSAAIILGYTDKIDAEILKDYSSVGVIHILSVSGLHVGVIFLILNQLLFFTKRMKHGKIIKAIVLLSFMWFYATITGLSPAVLRASAMFTFIVLGNSLNRNVNIYNTLAASMFFLLVINPFFLVDVGFQLSYLAVIGIVTFHPLIDEFYKPRNWVTKNIWAIISVSIAAQISTLPLTLFYFHQFPNYFIISNIVVIPLSNLAIYVGMVVLFASPFPVIASFAGEILSFLIHFLNSSIKVIEGFPYALISGIHISLIEMILLYVFIILMLLFVVVRKGNYLKYSMLFFLIFLSISFIDNIEHSSQRKIIVYNIKKATAIDFIDGKNTYLYGDSSFLNNSRHSDFYVKASHTNFDVKSSEKINMNGDLINENFYKKSNFVQFFNKRIAFINKLNFNKDNNNRLEVDYLVISDNAKINLKELKNLYNPKMIIFDSSNSIWKTEKWIKECEEIHLQFYSVLKSGALVLDI
ncbi:MAG: ComEC family competence protein [Bacteroidetes bacterium]|nr:ComEC family competence protein [Bacteroidota bacterium]